MNEKTYNRLKTLALVWIPAITTAYFTISGIWNIPHTAQVIGTLTALDTALGVILHVSTRSYRANPPTDGALVVDTSHPEKDVYSLELTTPPEVLPSKDMITLKVTPAGTGG